MFVCYGQYVALAVIVFMLQFMFCSFLYDYVFCVGDGNAPTQSEIKNTV